jgi:hypothetical protein
VARFSLSRGWFTFSSHTYLALEACSYRPASPVSLLARRVYPACDLPPQALDCSCTHALHCTALHPPAARYPLLSIGATGPKSIGATGAKDSPGISATGAAHLQLRLDRKWLTTPLDLHIPQLTNVLSPNTQPTQPSMDSFSGSICRFRRVGCWKWHGVAVLGMPCPKHNSSSQSSSHE